MVSLSCSGVVDTQGLHRGRLGLFSGSHGVCYGNSGVLKGCYLKFFPKQSDKRWIVRKFKLDLQH